MHLVCRDNILYKNKNIVNNIIDLSFMLFTLFIILYMNIYPNAFQAWFRGINILLVYIISILVLINLMFVVISIFISNRKGVKYEEN